MVNWTIDEIKEFLVFFAQNSDNVYWLSTPQFDQVKYISPAYEKIWGRPRQELYDNPEIWINFLHPEDSKSFHPIHEAKKQVESISSDMRFKADYRIVRPDGKIRWIMDTGFPIVDTNRKCIGVTGVAVDITEKKQLSHELKLKNSELKQVLAKYKNFVLNQEHDIRTPVSSVIGLADTLLERLTDPEDLEIAQLLLQSAQAQRTYQNSIVDSLYLFEKKTERYSRRFELFRKLEEVQKMFLCTFHEKQLKFSLDYDPSIPKKLVGDWFRLQQIIVCLLSNATKFTEPGGRIQLRCKGIPKAERRWVISIELEDTGIGIEESQLNTIFEPFVRLSLSNLGKYYGRGLGLTFVKKMVEELEGEIDVISTVGKGSVFYLLIPFASSWSEESPSFSCESLLSF